MSNLAVLGMVSLFKDVPPSFHDGCCCGNGMFRLAPLFELKHLDEIFQQKVFKMLFSKGKITEDPVDVLLNPASGGTVGFCLTHKVIYRTLLS